MSSNFNNLNKENHQNDLKYMFNVLYQTQNQEQIIHNILHGKKYLRLYLTDNNEEYFVFEKGILLKDMIPKFKKTDIYIPFIDKGSLNDYIENYTELKELVINSIEDKRIIIDISKTAINFKQKENEIKLTQTHNVRLKKNKNREEYINDYYLIYNFLKDNYPNTEKTEYAFYLNPDIELNRYVLIQINDFFNFKVSNLSHVFYLKEKNKDLSTIDCVKNILNLDVLEEDDIFEIDMNKAKELIKLNKNMQNF